MGFQVWTPNVLSASGPKSGEVIAVQILNRLDCREFISRQCFYSLMMILDRPKSSDRQHFEWGEFAGEEMGGWGGGGGPGGST
jgi:hypothetical protein